MKLVHANRLILDTGVLGQIVHPRKYGGTWRDAAKLWATARRSGRPSASPDALDGDVVIAAQAKTEVALVISANSTHFDTLGVDTRTISELEKSG